jgi:hypothetical protein
VESIWNEANDLRLTSIGEEAGTEDEAGIEDEAGNEADSVMNPASASPAGPEAFITAYSKINKVSLSSLARHWNRQEKEAFEKVLHAHCLSGGSRDDPTMLAFKCSKTPGCLFSNHDRVIVRTYESSCTPQQLAEVVEAKSKLKDMSEFACSHEGYDYRPSPTAKDPSRALTVDLDTHTTALKPCEYSCNPEKLLTKDAYTAHIRRNHNSSPNWLAPCTFPGCNYVTMFKNINMLKQHLKDTYKL